MDCNGQQLRYIHRISQCKRALGLRTNKVTNYDLRSEFPNYVCWLVNPSTKLLCRISIWRFPKLGVPPKSSILKGFSSINQQFLGTCVYGNLHMLMIRMCWIRFLWCAAEHSAFFTKSTHPNSAAVENHVSALQRIINHLDSSRNLVYTWAYMGNFPHVTNYQKLVEIMKIPWKIPLNLILYLMILYSYIPIKPIKNPILFLLLFFPCPKAPHAGDPNIRPHEFRLFLRGDQFEVTHRSRRWTSPSRKGVHAEHMDGKKNIKEHIRTIYIYIYMLYDVICIYTYI